MTLNIGNDALMCKVFSVSLHDLTLSWFHHLLSNFVNMFQDISEAVFLSPKAEHKHSVEHQAVGE